ncbi:MAG: DNA-processing protein DprA [Thermodesulfovibrionales bacterium]|nr:DNA-processing protein DprA [Thermodesulfovibrionales bacterium]
MSDTDIKYWLALTKVKNIGPASVKKLLNIFNTPEMIFKADFAKLNNILKEGQAQNIKAFNEWDSIDKEIEKIKRLQIKIVTFVDKEYPEPLKHIDLPPMILYYIGSLRPEDKYSIAIVGSRLMTEYGNRVATKLSSELASYGITIISGMARGIDAVSHRAAIKVGGRSIAVLGSGLDKPYPYENKELFKALQNNGCVLSEFPLGTPPNKENFPRRNRLISGLSLGVLVIEATKESGSLITANYALEQNKDVFAVPGNITSKSSYGTNELIKKGAKLVQTVEDILDELKPHLANYKEYNLRLFEKKTTSTLSQPDISEDEKDIISIIGNEVVHIDTLTRKLNNLTTGKLYELLLQLEIKGLIRQTEGNKYCII